MSQVIIGVGLPGIGKSDFMKKLAERQKAAYLATGDIRARSKFRSFPEETLNKEVWREIYRDIRDALSEGRDVIIDSSNTSRMFRMDLVNYSRSCGAHRVVAMHFHAPMEVARMHNRASERPMRDGDLERMAYHLTIEPPSQEEGFDAVAHRNIKPPRNCVTATTAP